MSEYTVFMKIKYDIAKEEIFIDKTDIKDERVVDFLTNWLRGQMGLGADKRPPEVKDLYTIIIKLDFSDDSFRVDSNTGNDSLTAGIVMGLLSKLQIDKKYQECLL